MLLFYLSMFDNQEDSDNFERAYIKYRTYLFNVAKSILKNDDDAEDALHNAFVSMAKHPKLLVNTESDDTRLYLFKVVKHAALKIRDQRNKRYSVEYSQDIQELFDLASSENMEDDMATKDEYQKLLSYVAKMEPKYRDVLIFFYVKHMSVREIADTLNIPISTAKVHLHRGRKQINEFWEKSND